VLVVAFLFPTGLELAGSWLGLPAEDALWRHLRRDPEIAAALRIETSGSDPGGAGEFLQEQLAQSGPFRYVGYGGVGYPYGEPRRGNYMEHRLDPNVQGFLVNGRPIFLGLYDIQGYNPLQLSRYVEFMAALNGAPQDYHTAYLLPSGARSPLLDLLDVRYLLVDASLPQFRDDVRSLTAGYLPVLRTPRVVVYERAPPPPHAWIVHEVRQVARGEALLLLARGIVDPYQTARVEGTPPAVAEPTVIDADSAEVTEYRPDHVTIETRSTSAGLLVVSEIYESGWRAYVDGASAPILPTDHALQGIPLPAGEHVVELRYEPTSLRAGLAISGVAGAMMLVAFAAAWWSFVAHNVMRAREPAIQAGQPTTDRRARYQAD
jgi:hypothetical protein